MKNILASFKRPMWPMRLNERLHLQILYLPQENNAKTTSHKPNCDPTEVMPRYTSDACVYSTCSLSI